jgi:xanthine dehydrogenase accessory factor
VPFAAARLVAAARRDGVLAQAQMIQGWFIEPVSLPQRNVWIWGAGHVGRALVQVLAPLPDVAITWVDTNIDRFPTTVPFGVRVLPAPDITAAVALAPPGAEHVILTYSHALDLGLCDAALRRGFARCGVIGSATKWARFRARLAALGHQNADIARIDCPIGDPALGKHPQAIAIGVAARMMARGHQSAQQEKHG